MGVAPDRSHALAPKPDEDCGFARVVPMPVIQQRQRLVFGSGSILWICFLIKFGRSASEIFNDNPCFGHGVFILIAIPCEQTLVLGCLLLSHVACIHRLIYVEENLSSRKSLPFGQMWLVAVPWQRAS